MTPPLITLEKTVSSPSPIPAIQSKAADPSLSLKNGAAATLAKLNQIRQDLTGLLVERDGMIDVLFRSILSRNHVCLLGGAGIAKTYAVELFTSRIVGASLFKRLMRKDSAADEVLGSMSLKGLENDEFRRVLDPGPGKTWNNGRVPNIVRAHVAILDEAFKSNATVLNGLLDVMADRRFQNHDREEICPLISAFLMSNEKPEEESLMAFYDRCLGRLIVKDIQEDSSFLEYLNRKAGHSNPVDSGTTVTLAELQAAIASVQTVDIPVDVNRQIVQLRRELHRIGIFPSPRRWGYAMAYVQATAWLDGRTVADPDDLIALQDCLWEKDDDIPQVTQILNAIASPDLGKIVEYLDAAKKSYDEVAGKSSPDASLLLEAHTKLRAAATSVEKIGKGSQSAKVKTRATSAGTQIKKWRAEMLEKLGMGGEL